MTAEKRYSINVTASRKKFCLSLHYNRANGYLFVSCTEIIKFKAIDSKTVATLLCLGNISKNSSADNMKRTGLYGNVYYYLFMFIILLLLLLFSADYKAIAVDDKLGN